MVLEEYKTLEEEHLSVPEDNQQEFQTSLKDQAEALVSSNGYQLLLRIMRDVEVTALRRMIAGSEEAANRAKGAITAIDSILDDLSDYLRGGEYEDETTV